MDYAYRAQPPAPIPDPVAITTDTPCVKVVHGDPGLYSHSRACPRPAAWRFPRWQPYPERVWYSSYRTDEVGPVCKVHAAPVRRLRSDYLQELTRDHEDYVRMHAAQIEQTATEGILTALRYWLGLAADAPPTIILTALAAATSTKEPFDARA